MRCVFAPFVSIVLVAVASASADWRDVRNGYVIPDEGYCDQPYVVVLGDGAWLCTMTTGAGEEGATKQHIVSTRSPDQGKTWGPLIDIEPPGPPEASWVTPLLMPSGRVYAFYTYNADNLRSVKLSNGGETKRVDTLGQFVFKYSDDGGLTWSAERFTIPVRAFAIDRENVYGGSVRFMWSVAKPLIFENDVYIGLSKVGNFGQGFIERSEGVVLHSANLLSEPDPAKVMWETLPDGDVGLRAPEGPIAEEQNVTFLSDGALFCTYRTTQGHPCHAYSRDGGKTWTPPAYMTYAPGGRLVKHPRAANFVRRFGNGKYLYWFHNHGGKTYEGRNPVWISGGVEKDGAIHWSQPEILLYDIDPKTRMSYPDFIEDGGKFFVTETQKTVARVHEIPVDLLDGMWAHAESRVGVPRDSAVDVRGDADMTTGMSLPALPPIAPGSGFTIELRLTLPSGPANGTILDTRDDAGKGIVVSIANSAIAFALADGAASEVYESDPVLKSGATQNVTIIVDGGPRVAMFVIDGRLSDGGEARAQGWYRVGETIADINGRAAIDVAGGVGKLDVLRVYARALRVNEAIENQRADGE
ncbi:MAG: exo-alpha-sialidase [Candidatus Hydrogenedentes bacterium]|nr:exo-alpha-sialidase [Candidatus Hydrogenedentota bacterium]